MINAEYIGKKGTHLPFSGYNQLNHLGPGMENLPITGPDDDNHPCQTLTIACLNNFVDNPFAGIITDPNSTLSSPQVQYSQLLLPHPAVHWDCYGTFSRCQFHLSRAAVARREAVLQWPAVPGDLHLVEID